MKQKLSPLPFGLVADDLKYPSYAEHKTKADYARLRIDHTLTLYEVSSLGWVVATLKISNGSRRTASASTDRTYAVDTHGKTFTVGRGPHVIRVVTVFIRHHRVEALRDLVALYTKGLTDANTIRDRVSSRRAQGALNRAAGLTSWRW